MGAYQSYMERKEKRRKKVLKFLKEIATTSLSIIISVLFCLNSNIVLGNLGIESYQIKLADEARISNEYNESIIWYEKITKKNDEFSPFAHLALGEIYSLEITNKEYERAFEEFEQAFNQSNDPLIMNSCLHFIIQQIEQKTNFEYIQASNKNIDILDENHIDFVVNVFNKANEINPGLFSNLEIDFPVDRNAIFEIFEHKNLIKKTTTNWEYVSTITSHDGGLAYVENNEKIVLVDSWSELVDELSFTTIIYYKYYRYKLNEQSMLLPATEAIESILNPQERIYLGQLGYDKLT
ncbi:unknown [Clostridium sp. CAG:678]|jgi:hypothetical protein|nr:unknown [Clostridium sp. CAG:678]